MKLQMKQQFMIHFFSSPCLLELFLMIFLKMTASNFSYSFFSNIFYTCLDALENYFKEVSKKNGVAGILFFKFSFEMRPNQGRTGHEALF
jgi:hypothetical protein